MGKKKCKRGNKLVRLCQFVVLAGLVVGGAMLVIEVGRVGVWLESLIPTFFDTVHEQHNHRAFMLRVFNLYANTSELNMGMTLREVAGKTRQSAMMIGRYYTDLGANVCWSF